MVVKELFKKENILYIYIYIYVKRGLLRERECASACDVFLNSIFNTLPFEENILQLVERTSESLILRSNNNNSILNIF